MAYTNSSLATYTCISPNTYGARTHAIDTVTIHCTAGKGTAKSIGAIFATKTRRASSNYGIGYDGSIGLYVAEKNASQCSSNKANDQRAITIEVSSSNKHPYEVTKASYDALINLLVDICKRNPGIGKLRWKADKKLVGQTSVQNMTAHRWFAAKACPGDYLYNRFGQIADEVNARLSGNATAQNGTDNTAYKVKVTVTSLRIRCGPGTNYAATGNKLAPGVYTVVATISGKGSNSGWGKLKSGAGWIALDYATKL